MTHDDDDDDDSYSDRHKVWDLEYLLHFCHG